MRGDYRTPGSEGGARRRAASEGPYRALLRPYFQVLEERGFEVKLVDARQLKRVPGRKSDVLDCQWLQQLHTFGLLAGAFRPGRPDLRLAQLPASARDAGRRTPASTSSTCRRRWSR